MEFKDRIIHVKRMPLPYFEPGDLTQNQLSYSILVTILIWSKEKLDLAAYRGVIPAHAVHGAKAEDWYLHSVAASGQKLTYAETLQEFPSFTEEIVNHWRR